MSTEDAVAAGRTEHAVDDARVHRVVDGVDGPDVLLVHGLGGNVEHWHELVPVLADGHRVHRVDLPGFGRSPPDADGSVSAIAHAVAAEIRHIGHPMVVVGNSMGAIVAMLVARRVPTLVRGLVLVSPAVPRSRLQRWDDDVASVFGSYVTPLGLRALRRRWHVLGAEGVVDDMLRLCTHAPGDVPATARTAIADALRHTMDVAGTDEAYVRAVRTLGAMTTRRGRFHRMVDEVAAPAVVIQGEHDRLVLLESAEDIVRRHRWPLHVLPGVGHLPQLEAPRLVAGIIRGAVATAQL